MDDSTDFEEILSVAEVARILQQPEHQVTRLIRAQKLKAKRVGLRAWAILSIDVKALQDTQKEITGHAQQEQEQPAASKDGLDA